jgi:hypothetical protein
MRLEKSRAGMHHADGRPTPQIKSVMKQKLGAKFPRAALSATAAPPAIAVDFPQNGERVESREYTFRISKQEQGSVEVSIDDEPWLPCRQAEGFWWRDWAGYRAGPHSVFARIILHDGRGKISGRREFSVAIP